MITATVWLRDLANRFAQAVAIIEPRGTVVSFAELERGVARLAGGLLELGVRRGDRLAAFVPNGVTPIELLLAAARVGAISVGVNTRYRSDDLRHVIEQTRPWFS